MSAEKEAPGYSCLRCGAKPSFMLTGDSLCADCICKLTEGPK